MVSVRKRNDTGQWFIDYRDVNGVRRGKTLPKGTTLQQAHQEARKIADDPGSDRRMRFDAIANEYMRRCKVRVKSWQRSKGKSRGGLRPQSLVDYRIKLGHILERFGHYPIRKIRRAMIEDFLEDKLAAGLSPRMVGALRARLYSVFRFAQRREYISSNPVEDVGSDLGLSGFKQDDGVQSMSREECARFLSCAQTHTGKRDGDMFPLLFTLAKTGMRIGEATALTTTDIDLRSGQIHVRRTWVHHPRDIQETAKTSTSNRKVEMTPELKALLSEHVKARKTSWLRRGQGTRPWLFLNSWRKPMNACTVQQRFKDILAEAKLPSHYTPHTLRHTYARIALESHGSLQYVQRQLGHESIKTTNDKYGRWAVIRDQEVAARMDNGHVKVK